MILHSCRWLFSFDMKCFIICMNTCSVCGKPLLFLLYQPSPSSSSLSSIRSSSSQMINSTPSSARGKIAILYKILYTNYKCLIEIFLIRSSDCRWISVHTAFIPFNCPSLILSHSFCITQDLLLCLIRIRIPVNCWCCFLLTERDLTLFIMATMKTDR